MKRLALYFLLAITSIEAMATGWQITTRYFSIPSNPEANRIESIYLLKGYMKMVNGDLTTVFDLKKGEITYINTLNKTYWRGNPKRFLAEVRAELEASIEEKLAKVDASYRDEQRAIMKEMIEASFPSENSPALPSVNFTVRKEKEGELVSGFITTKYAVSQDGMPLENIWVTPDLSIAKDFDFIGLSQFLNQLAQGAYANSFESSNEYFNLLDKGYPVKVEIHRNDGSKQVSEVTNAKSVNLKPSDFSVPSGYTPGSLTDVGVWDGYN